MLEDLGDAPLSRRVQSPLLGRESSDCGCDLFLESLKTRVHGGYLPFSIFRLKCCATTKLIQSYHRKEVMKTASLAPLGCAVTSEQVSELRNQNRRSAGRNSRALLAAFTIG